jgi:CheY-like chemotaxis protein
MNNMRKPRVILCEDEITILDVLDSFFLKREYEVLRFANPTICPIYERHTDNCNMENPCADILITDNLMPRMTGIELVMKQSQRGCKLDIRNKAIISGNLDNESKKNIAKLGCVLFEKPFKLTELSAWVDECEKRFNLSQPLESL